MLREIEERLYEQYLQAKELQVLEVTMEGALLLFILITCNPIVCPVF